MPTRLLMVSTCTACGAVWGFAGKDDLAGKGFVCPACGGVTRLYGAKAYMAHLTFMAMPVSPGASVVLPDAHEACP